MPEKITSNIGGGRTYSFNEMSSGNEFVSRIKQQFEQMSSQQAESNNTSRSQTHQENKKHKVPKRTSLNESFTSVSMNSSSADSEPTTPMLSGNVSLNSEMETLEQLNSEARSTVKEIITNFEEITSQFSNGNSKNQQDAKQTFQARRQQKSSSSELDLSFEEDSKRTSYPAPVRRTTTASKSNEDHYYKIEVSHEKEVHRMVEKVTTLERKVNYLEKMVEGLQETIVNLIKTDNNDDENNEGDITPPIAKSTINSLPVLVSGDNSF